MFSLLFWLHKNSFWGRLSIMNSELTWRSDKDMFLFVFMRSIINEIQNIILSHNLFMFSLPILLRWVLSSYHMLTIKLSCLTLSLFLAFNEVSLVLTCIHSKPNEISFLRQTPKHKSLVFSDLLFSHFKLQLHLILILSLFCLSLNLFIPDDWWWIRYHVFINLRLLFLLWWLNDIFREIKLFWF